MRTLVIDNYDSFTYNLVHLLAEVNGEEPSVLRNDAPEWATADWQKIADRFDNIVISPGPGRPERSGDIGIARQAIAAAPVPILGVCLGHQAIAFAHGAAIVAAPRPMHGRVSRIRHEGDALFAGIPPLFAAGRYHSLLVALPLPAELLPTAWSEDGLLMALRHRARPLFGVQFHPESVLTRHGRRLIENFRDLTARRQGSSSLSVRLPREAAPPAPQTRPPEGSAPRSGLWRTLPWAVDTEAAFCALYARSPAAFWLDGQAGGQWSFLGDASAPEAAMLSYDAGEGVFSLATAGETQRRKGSFFEILRSCRQQPMDDPPPCPFTGGLVGWLGYEIRSHCVAPTSRRSPAPDAFLIRPGRYIAVDHRQGRTYLVASSRTADSEHWVDATEQRLACLETAPAPRLGGHTGPLVFRLARDRAAYLRDIAQALEWIGQGESYQLCLTNEISCQVSLDPLDLYRLLRKSNPAPHAAYLRWPGGQGERRPGGAVISASPERFLATDRAGRAQAQPIKGTARREDDPVADRRRAEALASSEKERAENVMIVDLLRNDLSRCCVAGSVTVPSLMALESYATVHTLVSTVTGQLRPGASPLDLLEAAFPGGSMTGAPKWRALELLEQLEQAPRGIYSGALGWLGDDGAMDLAMVIRTIVAMEDRLSIGCGGGIVAQSDPEAEFEEILLKARAPIAAIVTAATGGFAEERYRIEGVASASVPEAAS